MANDEFTRAMAYANSAISMLKRGEIPPYPQFYELFYTYATGVNPSLNERINAILGEGMPGMEIIESLFNEFLKSEAVDERINVVSELISKNIGSVHSAIHSASETAKHYSGSLHKATKELDDGISSEDLKILAKSLLEKTRNMQETNQALEKRLDEAGEEVQGLKQTLEEVQRQSMTDSLTKVYNRKFFDQTIDKKIAESRETGENMCLVMTDIDHFKNFNDTFGHQTGDQVLRLVAMTLKSNTKGRDLVCRYGGEEFVIILPNTTLEGAVIISDKIRKAIQAKELLKRSTNEKLGRITASFGVAQLSEKDTATTLIERADTALYSAKRNGRNRVLAENDKLVVTPTAA